MSVNPNGVPSWQPSITPMPVGINRWGEVAAWDWSAVPEHLRPPGLRFATTLSTQPPASSGRLHHLEGT